MVGGGYEAEGDIKEQRRKTVKDGRMRRRGRTRDKCEGRTPEEEETKEVSLCCKSKEDKKQKSKYFYDLFF